MNKVLTAAILAALALAVGAVGLEATTAYAAISCPNPAGNEPPGAQGKDNCNGASMDNTNPAGNTPTGWN